jgi:uncharacterized protein YecE (DUF72 family)
VTVNAAYAAAGLPVRIGTSGYSYKDWVGPFYPPGTKATQQLEYYAGRFDCLELNVTYYRIPDAKLLSGIAQRTPPGFDFVVKLHGDLTHKQSRDRAIDQAFHAALQPLREAGKLRGLLAQFPHAFRNTQENRAFLTQLRERFPDDPLFVELRRLEWGIEPVYAFLRQWQLGWVSVDEPALPGLLPPLALATTDTAYVRFHGRNAAHWYAGGPSASSRYDYLYSETELREWAEKIRNLVAETRQTYVFFNNCHAGQAPANAQAMKDLLLQLWESGR